MTRERTLHIITDAAASHIKEKRNQMASLLLYEGTAPILHISIIFSIQKLDNNLSYRQTISSEENETKFSMYNIVLVV